MSPRPPLEALRILLLGTLCSLPSLCSPILAQAADPPIYPGKIGFSVSGTQGAAGIFCSGFSCTPTTLGITRGETLTLTVRSNPGSVYLLVVGAQATACIKIPGLNNAWVGGSIIALAGTVNQRDLIRCWGGLGISTVPVPSTSKLGDSVVFQVVADNTSGPSLSAPVLVRITQ